MTERQWKVAAWVAFAVVFVGSSRVLYWLEEPGAVWLWNLLGIG